MLVFFIQAVFPDRNNSFQQNFLQPIEDIDLLSSNLKSCFASDYFLLSSEGLKITKFTILWTKLCAL